MDIRMKYPLLVAIWAISALPLFAQEGGQAAQNAPPPPSAGVIIVKPQTLVTTENLPARLEASREAVIQPQVSGIVKKRLFEEGSIVSAGEQLYQIDDSVYQANLMSAKAQLAQAQANRQLAQSTANRYAPLVKEKAVSRQTYDQALAEVKMAEANIMSAEAAIKQAEINLEYTKVRAPIAGVIGKSNVSEGSLVSLGTLTDGMAKIQQLDPMYVNITQSAADVMKIRQDMARGGLQGVPLTAKITLEDGTPYPHEGRMLFADQQVDQNTGELLLRASVPNPDGLLLPGLYVRVDMPRSQFHNAVLVPQGAVTRGKTDTVRVVAEDGTFAPREVKVAGTHARDWIVTDGLKAGEMVMVDTLSQLMGGANRITPIILGEDGKPLQSATGDTAPNKAAPQTAGAQDKSQGQ